VRGGERKIKKKKGKKREGEWEGKKGRGKRKEQSDELL
jgi:hypothetical protein